MRLHQASMDRQNSYNNGCYHAFSAVTVVGITVIEPSNQLRVIILATKTINTVLCIGSFIHSFIKKGITIAFMSYFWVYWISWNLIIFDENEQNSNITSLFRRIKIAIIHWSLDPVLWISHWLWLKSSIPNNGIISLRMHSPLLFYFTLIATWVGWCAGPLRQSFEQFRIGRRQALGVTLRFSHSRVCVCCFD